MLPIQVLINNMLYDFSQIGIPSDRVDAEFTTVPRKWNIGNIRRFMIFIGPMSSIFDYATFFLMLYLLRLHRLHLRRRPAPAMKAYYETLFHTGWFVESILTQTLIVHIIRTGRSRSSRAGPARSCSSSRCWSWPSASRCPTRRWRPSSGFVPLPAIYWAWIAGFLVVVLRPHAHREELVLQEVWSRLRCRQE